VLGISGHYGYTLRSTTSADPLGIIGIIHS